MKKQKREKPNEATERVLAPIEALMPIVRERLDAGQSVKLSPRGVSMRPMLREGKDSVLLSPPPQRLKKYDIPLYRRSDGKYVLHRIVKARDGVYTCVGDNQCRREHGVRHESVIAVVTAFNRAGKDCSVESFSYRLYCHAWHWTRLPRHAVRFVCRRIKRLFTGK